MRNFLLRALSIVASAALVTADVNSVIAGLKNLQNSLDTLNKDVQNVGAGLGGFGPALQVNVDSVSVDNQIVNATSQVNAANKFTADESNTLLPTLQAVGSSGNTSLASVTSKVVEFGGLSPVVLASLYQLKRDQGNLGFAFASKLDGSVIGPAANVLQTLNDAFDRAIKAFGG